jgi:RNA polymerase sigma-70 factor (ECF subfamily)
MIGSVTTTGDDLAISVERAKFESAVLPHLDAAYNLARWMMRNDHDAEDVVQESYFRALKYFSSYRGGDGKTWLLQVVRRTCCTFIDKRRNFDRMQSFDEGVHGAAPDDDNPEKLLLQQSDRQMLRQALETLVLESREILVLRELEGLSYRQIAAIVDIPIGTVMSRLARARKQLQERLAPFQDEET